jgi:hypothetical protein
MSLDEVLTLLNLIADQLEHLWIDRDAFGEALHRAGFTPQQIKQLSDEAQADPERRRRSRQAYAQMRANLEDAGKSMTFETLLKTLPPSGKPS